MNDDLDKFVKDVEIFLKDEFPQYNYAWEYINDAPPKWILYVKSAGYTNRIMTFSDSLIENLNGLRGVDALDEFEKYFIWRFSKK